MRYKVNSHIKLASSLMLKYIIEYYGGKSEVARMSKLTRQVVQTFGNYGYVPLSTVYSIAVALKVPIWGLSYAKLMEVFGENTPSIDTILKDLKILSTEQKEQILKICKKK